MRKKTCAARRKCEYTYMQYNTAKHQTTSKIFKIGGEKVASIYLKLTTSLPWENCKRLVRLHQIEIPAERQG